MDQIRIWGIKFNLWSKNDIVAYVQHLIDCGRTCIHLTGVNSETVVLAQKYPELKIAINDSDVVNIDNMFVTIALRILGYHVPERAATPDIFEMFLKIANEKRQSVYFLGAEEGVLDNMITSIHNEYPKLNIIGQHNGFFSNAEEANIVNEIATLSPTYLFLGLPSPQKETFIMKYKTHLNATVCYGVGGAFDVKGGKVHRAPAWIGRIGLEGFVRVAQNPRNYGKRVLKYYPSFVKLFLLELLKRIKGR